MFGRNGQNQSSGYTSGTYNYTSNYGNNSTYGGSTYGNSNNDVPKIKLGSYRVAEYNPEKLSPSINTLEQWKTHIPSSICMREETCHLTPTELRVEDYYMIRTGKADEKVYRGINNNIGKRSFNESLLKCDDLPRPLSATEGPLRQETLIKACGLNRVYDGIHYGNYNYNPEGGYGQNGYQNSGNNMFMNSYKPQQNNSNPFVSSSNSSNPFISSGGGGSSGNMFNNNGGGGSNPFVNSGNNSGGGNNPFLNNNNNNQKSNNIFGNNNSGGNSNPFINSAGSNKSNNPFTNNNGNNNPFVSNNNNNGGNIFNNNNNNNNNQRGNTNIFANNSSSNPFASNSNSNSNNPFANNNNNNNNNPFANNNNNNNIFQNNNNNNNGRNLFANNNNNNNGNNLFANNNNNNNNNGNNNNNSGVSNFTEYTILQFMGMMQNCFEKLCSSHGVAQTAPSYAAPFSTPLPPVQTQPQRETFWQLSENLEKRYLDWFKDPFEYDGEDEWRPRYKEKPEKKTYIIIRDDHTTQGGYHNYQNHYGNGYKGKDLEGRTLETQTGGLLHKPKGKNESITMGQYNQFYSDQDDILEHESAHKGNLKKTFSHISNGIFMSHKKERKYNEESIYGSNVKSRLVTNNQIAGLKYIYSVQVVWNESLRPGYINDETDNRIISGELLLKSRPSLSELSEAIMEDILERYGETKCKDKNLMVRKEANLICEIPLQLNKSEFSVKATLTQNKINVKEGYNAIFDTLEGWKAFNLLISNTSGKVVFPTTVDIENVDFEKDIIISKNLADIRGPLENYEVLIVFNSLPPGVLLQLPDERKARLEMKAYIEKASKKTGNRIELNFINFETKMYGFQVYKKGTPASSNENENNDNQRNE